MRCLFLFLNLLVLITHVASLGITVQSQTLVGTPTLVIWTRDDSDPPSMTFDLRFVQGDADAGLAVANVDMEVDDFFGTVNVAFPAPGQFVLKAVTGSPRNILVGTSQQITAIGLNPSSSSASPSASPSLALPSSVTTLTPTTTPSSNSASASNTASPIPIPSSPSSSGAAPPPASSPTSNPSPTSTSTTPTTSNAPPTTSTTPSIPPLSSLSRTTRRPNIGAIVGGVLAGIIILALLVFLFVLLGRRREALNRRLTFHRDMMVQPRLMIQSPASRPQTDPESQLSEEGFQTPTTTTAGGGHEHERGTTHLDAEHGLPRPLGAGHIVPAPKGPRPSIRRPPASAPSTPTRTVTTLITPHAPRAPAPLRTRRQKQLADRIKMLRAQIEEVQAGASSAGAEMGKDAYGGIVPSDDGHAPAGGTGSRERTAEERARVLEEMQREMVWLRDHEQSAWAMGLTDVLPPGHARYMTP